MNRKLGWTALALMLALPLSAEAHRAWMLPSATVFSGSGTEQWVTVDAAISNDLFYFEHHPLRIEELAVVMPDGTPGKAENQSTGRYRSTFDVRLTQTGTYKMQVVSNSLFGSYQLDGQTKRWRGTPDAFAKEVPANAQNLKVSQFQNRLEIFVTSGKPTEKVLQPTGVGLELQPVTHPNDLVVGEAAKFRFLLDGKPAPEVKVTVIAGGIRYRDKLNERQLTTDKDGLISVSWTEPGMYWLNASMRDDKASFPQAQERRANYVTTLEVLAQ